MIKFNVDEVADGLSLYGRLAALLDDLGPAGSTPVGLHTAVYDQLLCDIYRVVCVSSEHLQTPLCSPLCHDIDSGVCIDIDGVIFPYPSDCLPPLAGRVRGEENRKLAILREIPTTAMPLIAERIKGEFTA